MFSDSSLGGTLSGNEREAEPGKIAVILIAAFLLQTILSPNMAIDNISPNFFLIAMLVIAASTPRKSSTVIGFCVGLLFDLLGGSGVGCMALVMALASFAISYATETVKIESFSSWLIWLVLTALCVNLAYLVVLAIAGMEASFFASIVSRVLPWTLYDTVVGAIFWPLAKKAIVPPQYNMLDSRIQL